MFVGWVGFFGAFSWAIGGIAWIGGLLGGLGFLALRWHFKKLERGHIYLAAGELDAAEREFERVLRAACGRLNKAILHVTGLKRN